MGFPEWTLWGMGLAVAGALVAITLSWLGQSPHFLKRIGLGGARLDLRVRTFTGYALALLLLAIAFFLAGVPLGEQSESDALAEQATTPVSAPDDSPETLSSPVSPGISPTADDFNPTPATPETGAFSGPPATPDSAGSASEPGTAVTAAAIDGGQTLTSTTVSTSVPTVEATLRPADTATPAPTETPLPSLTPTEIVAETAVVNTSGSTVWLKRSPGGQNVVLVPDGELVIILAGRANQGGLLWREVATVAGVEGWLQEEFLALNE